MYCPHEFSLRYGPCPLLCYCLILTTASPIPAVLRKAVTPASRLTRRLFLEPEKLDRRMPSRPRRGSSGPRSGGAGNPTPDETHNLPLPVRAWHACQGRHSPATAPVGKATSSDTRRHYSRSACPTLYHTNRHLSSTPTPTRISEGEASSFLTSILQARNAYHLQSSGINQPPQCELGCSELDLQWGNPILLRWAVFLWQSKPIWRWSR